MCVWVYLNLSFIFCTCDALVIIVTVVLLSSGVVAYLELGEHLEVLFPPLISLFFSYPPLSSPPLLLFAPVLPPCCKLPKRGVGWSPRWNRIWGILVLKYDIWWQQFQWFCWESTYYRLCISLQAYFRERYCSSFSWYHFRERHSPTKYLGERSSPKSSPKNIWGNGIPPRSPAITPLFLSSTGLLL